MSEREAIVRFIRREARNSPGAFNDFMNRDSLVESASARLERIALGIERGDHLKDKME